MHRPNFFNHADDQAIERGAALKLAETGFGITGNEVAAIRVKDVRPQRPINFGIDNRHPNIRSNAIYRDAFLSPSRIG